MVEFTLKQLIQLAWEHVESTCDQDHFTHSEDFIRALVDNNYVGPHRDYLALPIGTEEPDGIRTLRATYFNICCFILAAEGEL